VSQKQRKEEIEHKNPWVAKEVTRADISLTKIQKREKWVSALKAVEKEKVVVIKSRDSS